MFRQLTGEAVLSVGDGGVWLGNTVADLLVNVVLESVEAILTSREIFAVELAH